MTAARSLIGTPFRHQARRPGVGVDCIGVLVCVARACGFTLDDRATYGRSPDGASLMRECREQLVEVPVRELAAGDVAVFWVHSPGCPQHVGICTGEGLIHTHAGVGRVVEHRLTGPWADRLVAAFRFRELAHG